MSSFVFHSWGVVVSVISSNEEDREHVNDSPKENIPIVVNKQTKLRKAIDSTSTSVAKDDILPKKRKNRSMTPPATFDDIASSVVVEAETVEDDEEEVNRPLKKAPGPVKPPRLSDSLLAIPVAAVAGNNVPEANADVVMRPTKPEVKKGRFNRFASFGPIVDSLSGLK
jgi:hypothetical protein